MDPATLMQVCSKLWGDYKTLNTYFWEAVRARSAGIGLEATMSASSDPGSELDEQFDLIDRTEAHIEAERKYLKDLIAIASRPDDALPPDESLSFARTG